MRRCFVRVWLLPILLLSFLVGCAQSLPAEYVDGGDTDSESDSDSDTVVPAALVSEAGHVEIEPYSYTLNGVEQTTCTARIFYSFHPGKIQDSNGPLFVMFNGGPGVASEMIMSMGTSDFVLDSDQGSVEANSHSWTVAGDLLYLDARQTGFSYDILEDPSDPMARQAQLSSGNFNIYTDADDLLRALLLFLEDRPDYQPGAVFLVGESYGGVRAVIMSNILLNYREYGDGERPFADADLADMIQDRYDQVFEESAGAEFSRSAISQWLEGNVLIQPLVAGTHQMEEAGLALQGPQSPLWDLADEVGVPFVPCDPVAPGCDPLADAHAYVAGVERDAYYLLESQDWLWNLAMGLVDYFHSPIFMEGVLQVNPMDLEMLYADHRVGAFRFAGESDTAGTGHDDLYGATQPWDDVFVSFNEDVAVAFYTDDAAQPMDPVVGELFLENAAFLRSLITCAAEDVVIFAPGIPVALGERYPHLVQQYDLDSESMQFQYQSGVFGEDTPEWSKIVAFPRYEGGGHIVSHTNPEQLLQDVRLEMGLMPEI